MCGMGINAGGRMRTIKITKLKDRVIRKLKEDSFFPQKYYQQYLLHLLDKQQRPPELNQYEIESVVRDWVDERIRLWDVRQVYGFIVEFERYMPANLTVGSYKGVDLVEDDWVVFW